MTERRNEGNERRRPSVSLNLAEESRTLAKAPKGLIALVKRLLPGQR